MNINSVGIMSVLGLSLLLVLLATSMLATYARRVRRVTGDRLPGPRALPFLGNILALRAPEPWLKLAEWKEKYGVLLRWI